MSEETIIAFKNEGGFRISKSDLTTGKVIVNGIEITSVEDWTKVTQSIVELQQENQKYKEVIYKAINDLKQFIKDKYGETLNSNMFDALDYMHKLENRKVIEYE